MTNKPFPYHNSDINDYPSVWSIIKNTDKIPSRYEYIAGWSFASDKLDELLNKWGSEDSHTSSVNSITKYTERKTFTKVFDNDGDKTMMVLEIPSYVNIKKKNHQDDEWDDERERSIMVLANVSEELWKQFRTELTPILKKTNKKENNISLIIQTRHGYDTQEFDLPKQKLDLEYNYGSSFLPVHEKILSTLNKSKSNGLVLLHGTPGTGKTHYLKYLASKIKDKKVMFVPPYLVDFITSPEMTPFLIENSDSILFIEDAERVITDRSENGANGVSNIFNLTDGILGDILNIQIVATFNMDRKKIDTALLRKGRLIAEHKFDKLSLDDTNKLIKHLGLDHDATEELTLTEIYNLKEIEYKVEEPKRKIGF